MKVYAAVLVLSMITLSLSEESDVNPLSQEFIDDINEKATTWRVKSPLFSPVESKVMFSFAGGQKLPLVDAGHLLTTLDGSEQGREALLADAAGVRTLSFS